jgi:hypothetical protein
MSVSDEDLRAFQRELWDFTTKYVKGDEPSSLFMVCGVMLRTTIEMYVSVLKDDEIGRILEEAENSIPMLRENLESAFKNTVIH